MDLELSRGEVCGLGLLNCASSVLVIAYLVMFIWGSVIVFGSWATWTDDYEKYAGAPEEYNFCAYDPMMFAFVLLVMKFTLIPALIVLASCYTAYCGSPGCAADNMAQTQTA